MEYEREHDHVNNPDVDWHSARVICENCGKQANKKCARCKYTNYCSRACQKAQWKHHKKICRKAGDGTSTSISFKNAEQIAFEQRQEETMSGHQLQALHSIMKMGLQFGTNQGKVKEAKQIFALYDRTPSLEQEFQSRFQSNRCFYTGMDLKASFDILHQVVQESRSLYLKESMFTNDEMFTDGNDMLEKCWLTPYNIMKRLNTNHPEAIKWFFESKPSNVRTRSPDELLSSAYSKSAGDAAHIYHSFTNSKARHEILRAGKVHVAIGYVDLSPLLQAIVSITDDVQRKPSVENTNKPLIWIGYEASPFAVAKTLVITEMLRLGKRVDSIIQVWYSSIWNDQTQNDFSETLHQIPNYEKDSDVALILNHWIGYFHNKTELISLSSARASWLSSIDSSFFDPSVNAIDANNRAHLTDFLLTGQLLDGIHGSVTMFSLPKKFRGRRARNESMFHGFDYPTLVEAAKRKNNDFVEGAIQILRERVTNLQKSILDNEIEIQIRPPTYLSLDQPHILESISKLEPFTISWNNVSDYMTIEDFHTMARRCSAKEDTAHFAYSLNWPCVTKGTFCFDYAPGEFVKLSLEAARKGISFGSCLLYGASNRMFLDPPIDNPINLTSLVLCSKERHSYSAKFMEGVENVANVDSLAVYNHFCRSNNALYMTWSYDNTIQFASPNKLLQTAN